GGVLYKPDRSIAKERVKAAWVKAAKALDRGPRCNVQARRLRPGGWSLCLDDHQGDGRPIGHVIERDALGFVEHGAGADQPLVDGLVRTRPGPRRALEHLGHVREERLVVWAIPGLVELEPLVERVLFKIGEQEHTPAQQRFAVGIAGCCRWERV